MVLSARGLGAKLAERGRHPLDAIDGQAGRGEVVFDDGQRTPGRYSVPAMGVPDVPAAKAVRVMT